MARFRVSEISLNGASMRESSAPQTVNLDRETQAGRFRQDFFYRIHGFRLNMPTLRERREDIPALAEYFRAHFEKQFGTKAELFAPEMLAYLKNLNWPGNLRELSNGVARYVLIGPEAAIHQEQPSKKNRTMRAGENDEAPVTLKRLAKDAIREMERNVILDALRNNQWNRRKTAQALKISYRALIYKIHDAGLMTRKAAQQDEQATNGSGDAIAKSATD